MKLRSIVPRFWGAKLTVVELSESSVAMAVLVNGIGRQKRDGRMGNIVPMSDEGKARVQGDLQQPLGTEEGGKQKLHGHS